MKVIVGNFEDVEDLKVKGFTCIGGECKSKEHLNIVVGLSNWTLRYDLLAKDYEATTTAFNHHLSEKHNNFIKLMNNIGIDKNIAIIGSNTDYSLKFIMADYFIKNITKDMNIEIEEISYYNCSKDNFDKISHTNDYGNQNKDIGEWLTSKEVQSFLEDGKWIFAKTMPKNPHYYILRKNYKGDDIEKFYIISSYIRKWGELEYKFGSCWRVLKLGNYKYWSHPIDRMNRDVDLINRADI